MWIVRWIFVGALVIAAQVLLSDLSQARDWTHNCDARTPSCFSFEISRDGYRVILTNDCREELGVVPVIGDSSRFHWPVTIVYPGHSRSRSARPWLPDTFTGVRCCQFIERRGGSAFVRYPSGCREE